MNLDELQSAQSRERQTDSLQQLRGSFYEEAGRFVQQLREERAYVAEQCDDPFDAPDVQRLTNEINTAEQTVESIYERRIGKLVKQASLEAAGMTADAEGLTTEEREAFDKLVSTIEENRDHVLSVLANDREQEQDASSETRTESETTTGSETTENVVDEPDTGPEPDSNSIREREQRDSMHPVDSTDSADPTPPPDPAESVEAPNTNDGSQTLSVSDMMGDSGEAQTQESGRPIPPDVPVEAEPQNTAHEQTDLDDTNGEIDSATDRSGMDFQVDRTPVKITRDVGKILCVDEREYDLSKNDVVELPETNVGPLLANNAAERLD
jgi:DNA replication factor GINS